MTPWNFCATYALSKTSNIDVDDSSSNIGESINNGDTIGDDNDQSELEASGAPIKRKKSSGQQSNALERIADTLCQPPTSFEIPAALKLDEIDSTLEVIGCRVRKMNSTNQLDVIQHIMNLTYDILKGEH
ncbi:uncharacterized protein LOC115242167 [Formica exsecta]|uniref:uncharacterized protein LOC115242167 n=1 Tax=Formica exsecta TaxID=72781 RepID=UPI001142B267|nr:uncharacterized protein LOC115242167 [Formica exsecta]